MKENLPLSKKSKIRKRLLIFATILVIIIGIVPFALDFYLKKQLPEIVNKKTPYNLKLTDFDLSLFSGNLTAKNIEISNKNPADSTKTLIKGTIKKLSIENIAIWKAIFRKQYVAKSFLLQDPNVFVILNSSEKKKKEKKKIDLNLENILISNGNVTVLKKDKSPFFTGKNINIKLTKIQQSDNKSKIPIAFEEFKIDVENVIVKANEFYQISAKKIETKNKELNILNFRLKPTKEQKSYNAKSIFDFEAEKLSAKDFIVDKDSLIVDQIKFVKPNLKVTATQKKTIEKTNPKEISLKIGLKNITFEDGKLLILQSDLEKTASVDHFNFKLNDIVFDKNTVKEKIPFHFKNHDIEADNIFFKINKSQAIKIGKISSKDHHILIEKPSLKSLSKAINHDTFDAEADEIKIINNQSKYIGQKLDLKIAGIEIRNPDIKMHVALQKKKNPTKKTTSPPEFSANLGYLNIINGKLEREKSGQQKVSVGKFNIKLNQISSNTKMLSAELPFLINTHHLAAENIKLDAGKYYNFSIKNLSNQAKQTEINHIKFSPKYSRESFSRVIPHQMDLYDIAVQKVLILDQDTKIGKATSINLDKVIVQGLDCSIYHDLNPPADKALRYFLSKKLRDLKLPVFVKQIEIKKSNLTYEENAKNANRPGKLTFNNFNANIANVNSAKMANKPTLVTVDVNFDFFGTAPTDVHWSFDVADKEDKYKINGSVNKLSADNVNLFVRPYLNVTLDGKIDYVKFDYYGNSNGIAGKFYFKYKDMYVNILNKKTGKERKMLTTVANWFVKNESTGEPDHVLIKKKREEDKSFFNMLWQGIMEGLKKYVI